MAFDIKSLFRKKQPSAPVAEALQQKTGPKQLPVIGRLHVELQYQILGSIFLVSLLNQLFPDPFTLQTLSDFDLSPALDFEFSPRIGHSKAFLIQ